MAVFSFLWKHIPDKFKILLGLMIAPTIAISYYQAWHVGTIKAHVEPIRTEYRKDIKLLYLRQDDLQRSFNSLEDNMNKNHQIMLEAILKN